MVVYGTDSLDEISASAPTYICEVKGEDFKSYTIEPEMFGFSKCAKEELIGGTPEENAAITRKILSGERSSDIEPKRNAVILNSAAALYIAGKCSDMKEAAVLAANLIDSGKALKKLESFIKMSNEE